MVFLYVVPFSPNQINIKAKNRVIALTATTKLKYKQNRAFELILQITKDKIIMIKPIPKSINIR